MFKVCVGTDLGAGRLALACGAEAVGKLFTVVGKNQMVNRCRADQAQEEAALQTVLTYVPHTPAGDAVTGGIQVAALVVIRA